MRALITRPRDDAERVAAPLRERGVDVLLDPLLTIRFLRPSGRFPWSRDPLAADLRSAQALIFTSANGVRAFAAVSRERARPVFAVGDTTAAVARDMGFAHIENARGDVNSLAALILQSADPTRGPLMHICGNKVAGDLPGMLAPSGFTVIRRQLYEARPATVLFRATLDGFRNENIDAVFLFSPRTAQIFSELVRAADLAPQMRRVVAYALSPAVANALGDLPLQAVRVSPEPTQASLIALFDADSAADTGLWSGRLSPETPSFKPPGFEAKDPGLVGSGIGATDFDKTETVRTPVEDSVAAATVTPPASSPGSASERTVAERPVWELSSAGPKPSLADRPAAVGTVPTPPWPGTGPTAAASKPASSAAAGTGPKGTGKAPPSTPSSPRSKPGSPGRKRGCLGCFTPLLLLLLLSLAVPGSYAYWRNQLPKDIQANLPPLPNDPAVQEAQRQKATLDRLRQDLAAAQRRAAALEVELADVRKLAEDNQIVLNMDEPLDTAAAAFLNRRLDQFQTRLETMAGSIVTPANILSLTDRVTEIEKIARETHVRRVSALTLLSSVSHMREAMDSGEPFVQQVLTLAAVTEDDPGFSDMLARLRPVAAVGVQPRSVLRSSFAETAREVTRAVALSENDGWADRALGSIKSVIVVRRTDLDSKQPEPLTVLAQAERLVRQNDLADALKLMEKLQGPALDAAMPWVEAVRNRLQAEAALNELTSLALAEVNAARARQPGVAGPGAGANAGPGAGANGGPGAGATAEPALDAEGGTGR